MSGRMRLAAGLAAGALLLVALGGLYTRSNRTETYEVTAYFPRAIGLFERSTVRVLGVEVGRVSEVSPQGDRVRVRLAIDESVRVPSDASAIIVPISLISDRYVQLAPVYDSGPALRDGDEIPLERGIAPAELDDLLKVLKDFAAALEPGTADEPGALGQFVVNANDALGGKGEALGTTVDSLATLLDVLGRNADDFDSTIVSLDRIIGTLATRDDSLVRLNRGLASVFSAVAEERDALGSGLGNLTKLLGELGDLVRTHRRTLEEDLLTLADTTDAVIRQEAGLLRNILWLPVLAEGLTKAYDREQDRINVRDHQSVRLG